MIMLGYAPAQQPNTDRIRTWEIAGTSHADIYEVGGNASVLGCTAPINTGPQHVVVQTAFAAFSRWVEAGTPPPKPTTLQAAEHEPTSAGTRPAWKCDRGGTNASRRSANVNAHRVGPRRHL